MILGKVSPFAGKALGLALSLFSILSAEGTAIAYVPADWKVFPPPRDGQLTTLFIAGDSTAATPGGWGRYVADYFDTNRINICDNAKSGASSRTFYNDGWWGQVRTNLKAGDLVLIQFGHNDGSPVNESESVPESARRSRGSLKGIGDETQDIVNIVTKREETIHTFGWYLSVMTGEAKAKGATVYLLSHTPKCSWNNGKIERNWGGYQKATGDVARRLKVPFIDLHGVVCDTWERLGLEKTKTYFPKDMTHTSAEGSVLHAEHVVGGLRALPGRPIDKYLSPKGLGVKADPKAVPDP